MKNLLLSLLLITISCSVFGQEKAINFKSGEILIQLESEVLIDDFLKDFQQTNQDLPVLNLKRVTAKRLNLFLLNFDENKGDIMRVLDEVKEHPQVLSAGLNYELQMRDSIPDDPFYTDQWSLDRIQAPDVWAFSTGGTSYNNDEIVIAVVDSGFDIEHEDLAGNIWENTAEIPSNGIDDDNNGHIDDVNGWNFLNDLAGHPVTSHGTSVTGILGAKGNNNTGVTGVNWNVKVMLLTARFSEEIAAAYNYVLEQRMLYNNTNGAEGAFVVVTNASLGIDNVDCENDNTSAIIGWRTMYNLMGDVGIVSVGATSNNRMIDVDVSGDMPTSCESPYLITVTNNNFEDEREGGFGLTSIDLAAPGSGSTTIRPGSEYNTNFGGTSAACPHVAGAVGLLFSLPCEEFANLTISNPSASALLIKEAILEGVDPIAELSGETVTGGRLNIYKSAQYLHSYCVARDFEQENASFSDTYVNPLGFVRVFSPDPTGDKMLIDFSTMNFEPIEVGIYNSVGQLMYKDVMRPELFDNQTFELDVQGWAVGAYFISVLGIKSKVSTKFFKF